MSRPTKAEKLVQDRVSREELAIGTGKYLFITEKVQRTRS